MTEFYRLSGGGNDFLALVEPDSVPARERIAAWCARGRSEGADGLFVLARSRSQPSTRATMDYFNADGGAAELCLNATRCAARLAAELGWTKGPLEILTGAGPVRAEPRGTDLVALDLPVPAAEPEEVALELDGEGLSGLAVTVGVPHLVVFREESLAALAVVDRGRPLRHHPRFAPAGANVDFVRLPRPDLLEIRTYERGVEAETLACGTGVLSAVWCAWHRHGLRLPVVVRTLGNLPLRVEGESRGRELASWSLVGDARVIAKGRLLLGAETRAAPPRWSV